MASLLSDIVLCPTELVKCKLQVFNEDVDENEYYHDDDYDDDDFDDNDDYDEFRQPEKRGKGELGLEGL